MTDDATRRIDAYLDGELDAADRAVFEASLAEDPGLRAAVDGERALRRQVVARLVEGAPLGMRARIAKALDHEDLERNGWDHGVGGVGVGGVGVGDVGVGDGGGEALASGRQPKAPSEAPAAARGRVFHFAYAAAVVVLTAGVFLVFGGDTPERATPDDESADAVAELFDLHAARMNLPGEGFGSRDGATRTFLGMSAPDLCEIGWNFERGVRGRIRGADDPFVWVRYVADGERELSLLMYLPGTSQDDRIPVAKDTLHVERRGDGVTGVFWRESNGIVCGVVARASEEELRFLADAIRLQGG